MPGADGLPPAGPASYDEKTALLARRTEQAADPYKAVPAVKSWEEPAPGALHQRKETVASAPRGSATGPQLVLNLVACGLGTGAFTLPWSTAGASVVPAALIVAGVLALNAWTISILVQAAERHQVFDLGGLLGRLPGQLGRAATATVNVVLWLSMYLCLVGYVVVIVDCVQSSMPKAVVKNRPALVVMTSMAVLPLCFLDQRRLAATSFVALAANLNILVFLAMEFGEKELEGTRPPACYLGFGTGGLAMVSAMMQTVVIQMCVLPMYAEMRDRSVGAFDRAVAVSFGALFCVYVAFAVLGYLAFGQGVNSNVLLDLPDTRWGNMARLCAAASVVGVYPIVLGPMLAPLRATEGHNSPTVVGLTCLVVVAAMAAAMQVTDLGLINIVNGAVSMGCFVAVVPCLAGLFLLGPHSEKPGWRLGMWSLAIAGIVCSVLGLFLTDNYATQLQETCRWMAHGKLLGH